MIYLPITLTSPQYIHEFTRPNFATNTSSSCSSDIENHSLSSSISFTRRAHHDSKQYYYSQRTDNF